MDEVASATAAMATAPDITFRAKGKRLLNGWCTSQDVQREVHVAWEKREEDRKQQRGGAPKRTHLFQRSLQATAEQLDPLRARALNSFSEGYL